MAKKTDGSDLSASVKGQLAKLVNRYKHPDKLEWVRTGIHALDLCIGNGIPRGRVIEIFGDEQGGKSLLAWEITIAFQKLNAVVILCDVEATAPREFMQLLGVNVDDIVEPPETPRTVEDVRDFVKKVTDEVRLIDKTIPILVIWDSVAATSAFREWENFEKFQPKEINVGTRAQAVSKFFREFTSYMSKNDVTMIAVNQVRDKIGVMFGKTHDSPGGRGLKFHASVRLELNKSKRIDRDGKTVGVMCRIYTEKNKTAPPFRKAVLDIYWNKGFDRTSGMIDILSDTGRISDVKQGTFKIGEQKYKESDIAKAIEEHPELVAEWIK